MKFWYLSLLAVFCTAALALAQDQDVQPATPPAEAATPPAEAAAPADESAGEEAAEAGQADPSSGSAAEDPPQDEAGEDGAEPAEAEPAEQQPAEEAPPLPGEGDEEGAAAAEGEPVEGALQTDRQKISYAIGVSIGRGLQHDQADLDAALVGQGLVDGFGGGKTLLSDEEIRQQIIAFQERLRGQAAAERPAEEAAGDVRAAAAAFLEQNKQQEGVVSLPSGLQYQVLKEGDGDKPQATDTVRVHYRGTLIDGTEFDSSLDGEPIEFPLNGVIKGWTEGLQRMPVGSKWKLFIPAELGYGDRPPPGSQIRPGDALVFEVELLEIK